MLPATLMYPTIVLYIVVYEYLYTKLRCDTIISGKFSRIDIIVARVAICISNSNFVENYTVYVCSDSENDIHYTFKWYVRSRWEIFFSPMKWLLQNIHLIKSLVDVSVCLCVVSNHWTEFEINGTKQFFFFAFRTSQLATRIGCTLETTDCLMPAA